LKTLLVITIAALILGLSLIVGSNVRNQVKRMNTLDTMGQILVALDKTMPTAYGREINAVEATRNMFPSILITNHEILDAWRRPIQISVKKIEQGFAISIVSSGPDGVFGTKDDIVRNEVILFKSKTDGNQ